MSSGGLRRASIALGAPCWVILAFLALPVSGAEDENISRRVGKSVATPYARSLAEQAVAHEHGEGVPRDLERAAALYCEAARLGDAESMYALGWMYANGRGLPRDDVRAGGLFAMAAERGHVQARHMLRFTGEHRGKGPECLYRAGGGPLRGLGAEARMRILSPERQAIARLVEELAPRYQIDPRLALAIALTESNLDSAAVSPKNAQGVMQLMPETAARFNVRDPFDPRENIKGGLAYLRWLLAYFRGNVALAAAGYNAGEGAVDRYRGIPPYRETRAYVERVLAAVEIRDHPFDSRIVEASAILPAARIADGRGD